MYFFLCAITFNRLYVFASFFRCKEIHIAKVRIISAEKNNLLYVMDNSLAEKIERH